MDKSTFDHVEHKLEFNMAVLYLLSQNPNDAKRTLDKLYDNSKRKGIHWAKLRDMGHMYTRLGFWFRRKGKPHRSAECLETACALLNQTEDYDQLCKILVLLTFQAWRDSNDVVKYVSDVRENVSKISDDLTKGKG
jgi:hypothetical protein